MKFSKLLITGAQGQLGQALQAQFVDHEVIAWDIQALDICQLEHVRKGLNKIQPDLVMNAAAFTQVDQAETHQDAAYRGNALGPRNLALATQEMNVPLVHFSTDYVFDGRQVRPYHEFDRPNPQSVYGQSKLAGEEAVQNIKSQAFYCANGMAVSHCWENFPQTILRLANQGHVRVVNDQFGSPTYCPHLAAAVSRLIKTESYGTYHLSGSGGTSWYEFTKTLYDTRGIQTEVRPITTAEYPFASPTSSLRNSDFVTGPFH